MFAFVEEKKVFTKSDLKTGMFGVMSNDQGNFVIVGDKIIYKNGGFDTLHLLNEDMDNGNWKIEKVYDGCLSFNNLDSCIRGTSHTGILVYDRERDTKKPLYNGKVVCVKNTGVNSDLYTVGKIYQFVDGSFTADDGTELKDWRTPIESFKEFNDWSNSEWLEIKE